MSQIISLHVGGTGSRIGAQFWKLFFDQESAHNENGVIDPNKKAVFYQEGFKHGQYCPRAIYIDSDPRVRNLVDQTNPAFGGSAIITGQQSCHNLWTQGKHSSGLDWNEAEDTIRKSIQKCDRFSGFLINYHTGGGAGAGLSSLLLSHLRENYPSRMVEVFNFLPNINTQTSISNHLQIYNTILSQFYIIEYADLSILMNNHCIENSLMKTGNLHPPLSDINKHVARGMIEHIAPYRYSGCLNTNQRKRCLNLLMFPRMKFLVAGLSRPHLPEDAIVTSSLETMNRFYSPSSIGSIYTSYFGVRNPFASEPLISTQIRNSFKLSGIQIAEWVPHPFGLSITNTLFSKSNPSVWSLINSSHNIEALSKHLSIFSTQFRRRAFLHHYMHWMDQMQFTEAESNCNDLISEYTPCTWGHDENDEDEYDQSQAE